MTVLKRSLQTPRVTSHLGARISGVNLTSCRMQSTIPLTSLPQLPKDAPKCTLQSTPSLSDSKDFSTHVQSDFEVLNQAVLSASALAHQPQRISCEMDVAEAAANKQNFDKILLLINHGEAAVKKNDRLGIPVLTGRGVGQALTLSHQTSMFCNSDTGLSPELVVLAPLGCSIQTTLHAFPYNAPDSVRGVSWICHGDLCPDNVLAACPTLITRNFPGMDLSHYESNDKSEAFLEWLKSRDEQVIVVSSTEDWLESFCKSTLDCDTVSFQTGGEMRVVGLY